MFTSVIWVTVLPKNRCVAGMWKIFIIVEQLYGWCVNEGAFTTQWMLLNQAKKLRCACGSIAGLASLLIEELFSGWERRKYMRVSYCWVIRFDGHLTIENVLWKFCHQNIWLVYISILYFSRTWVSCVSSEQPLSVH